MGQGGGTASRKIDVSREEQYTINTHCGFSLAGLDQHTGGWIHLALTSLGAFFLALPNS